MISDEVVMAFQEAWNATPKGAPGDRTRAGLEAAFRAKAVQEAEREADLREALKTYYDKLARGEISQDERRLQPYEVTPEEDA